MNDSRKDDRLNVALVMRYREPTMLEPREGQCQNVSLSGMCIVTPKPSPRGALIRFECISGGAADGIRGTARVVWQRGKNDKRGAACMGVRFVRLEPGCREALEALVDQLGGERKPSGEGVPRAPSGSEATAREAGGPGQATLIVSPATGSGVTQQGMGAARARAAHYPTLRGIGLDSSAPPRADARGSKRPAALNVTLPGHATNPPTPFPTTPSAPPDSPQEHADSSDSQLRDRLDRTRRGMGPLSQVPDSETEAANSPAASGASARQPAEVTANEIADGGDRAQRDSTSDRPPQPGSVDDLRQPGSSQPPRGASRTASGEQSGLATFEPEEAAWARRRAAAAAVPFDRPELPDLDAGRKKNWMPWVVIGGGLLASWVMIRAFGSLPAGVPVTTNVEEPSEPAQSAPAQPAEPTPAAPSATLGQAGLRTSGYVLEVASEPAGARISAGDRVMLAPASIDLVAVTGPLVVKAELEGYETTTVTVEPSAFTLQDGRHVGRTVVKLAPVAADSHSARAASDGATAKATTRKPRTRATDSAPSAPMRPAAPPVPIDPPAPAEGATSAPSPSASAEEPSSEGGDSTLDRALACMSRGDNLCVVSTLEGKARSAREFELLIETHLTLGNPVEAERNMRRYIERHPDGKRVDKYQRWLDRRGESAP